MYPVITLENRMPGDCRRGNVELAARIAHQDSEVKILQQRCNDHQCDILHRALLLLNVVFYCACPWLFLMICSRYELERVTS
jgi:hypothetical protein